MSFRRPSSRTPEARTRSAPAYRYVHNLTVRPSEDIGRLASEPRLVVAGGDSGHGFKHAAGIGEMLAQIVTGEHTYCAAGFMDPARFPDPTPRPEG